MVILWLHYLTKQLPIFSPCGHPNKNSRENCVPHVTLKRINKMLLTGVMHPTTSLRKTSNQSDTVQTFQGQHNYEDDTRQYQKVAWVSIRLWSLTARGHIHATPTQPNFLKRRTFTFKSTCSKTSTKRTFLCYICLVARIKGLGLRRFFSSFRPSKGEELEAQRGGFVGTNSHLMPEPEWDPVNLNHSTLCNKH